jgi:hypothetical protein
METTRGELRLTKINLGTVKDVEHNSVTLL